MEKVDLHVHTNASDGKFSPTEIVSMAKKAGLKAIAIADHDTTDGIDAFMEAGRKEGIKTISGCEFEINEKERGFFEIHILGLFIDHQSPIIKKIIEETTEERIRNKKEVIAKLNSLGYKITFEEVLKETRSEIGRPHIARVLIKKYPDKFKTIGEVFEKLLGTGKPGFVPRKVFISFKEIIDAIHEAGGIAVLAHPFYNKNPFEVIDYFIENGGDAVETIYPYAEHAPEKDFFENGINELKQKMLEKGVLESGGSDYHGTKTGEPVLGEMNIPYIFVEKMKERLKNN